MEKRYTILNAQGDPYVIIGGVQNSKDWWRFGTDNLFPQAIALLNRRSAVHRGILQSKSRYISGDGFTTIDKKLELYLNNVNVFGESLKDLTRRLVFDYQAFGNCFMEMVTNPRGRFLNLYHQDATKCRLSYDKKYVLLHHDWRNVYGKKGDLKKIPLYPVFEDMLKDGNLRTILHLKNYEPEYENYGLVSWIAGLNVSAIAYKTDKWNISRLDNAFNSSGVLMIDSEFESEKDLADFKAEFNKTFIGEGKQGKVLMLIREPGKDPGTTQFTPITQPNEGDWKELHAQSTSDLIIAHNWFRSLAGIADNTGFDTQRILNEYEVALNTVIKDGQEVLLNWYQAIIGEILRYDTSDLAFVNHAPMRSKPAYMKVWEARKADGLEYDENDPVQSVFISQLQKQTLTIQ